MSLRRILGLIVLCALGLAVLAQEVGRRREASLRALEDRLDGLGADWRREVLIASVDRPGPSVSALPTYEELEARARAMMDAQPAWAKHPDPGGRLIRFHAENAHTRAMRMRLEAKECEEVRRMEQEWTRIRAWAREP